MKKKGESRANQRREINREELKRFLSERGKVDYIFDCVEKLEDLSNPMEGVEVQRVSKAIDARLRLLNKYLPDEKAVELKNADGEVFKTQTAIEWTIQPVKPIDESDS